MAGSFIILSLKCFSDKGVHLRELLLHAAKQLVLSSGAHQVVLRILYLVVAVSFNIVHQEPESLLVGDVDAREGQVLDLGWAQMLSHLRGR